MLVNVDDMLMDTWNWCNSWTLLTWSKLHQQDKMCSIIYFIVTEDKFIYLQE